MEDLIWHYLNLQKIFLKKPIYVFNKGNHVRDFTYIDNISNNILKIINIYPKGKNSI